MNAAQIGLILTLAALAAVWWQYRAEEARADRWEGEALLWKRHARQLEADLELARAVDLAWMPASLTVVEDEPIHDGVVIDFCSGRPLGGAS